MDDLTRAQDNLDAAQRYLDIMATLRDADARTDLTHAQRVSLYRSCEAMAGAHNARAYELLGV